MLSKDVSRRDGCVREIPGFTLVELLVVISIIALLLAILMPAMAKARQIAYRLVCAGHLKQINVAATLWSEDHDGFVLHYEWAHPDEDIKSYEGLESYTKTNRHEGTLYRCPAVPITQEGGGVHMCYGINLFLVTKHNPVPTVITRVVPRNGHGRFKLSQIKRPVERVYFLDITTTATSPGLNRPLTVEAGRVVNELFLAISLHPALGINFNTTPHSGSANIAWMDGHVSREPKNFRSLDGGYFPDQYYFIGRHSNGLDEP